MCKPVVSLRRKRRSFTIQPVLVRPERAAKLLGVSIRFLAELEKTGKVPSVRLGTCLRFSPDALRDWALHESKFRGAA